MTDPSSSPDPFPEPVPTESGAPILDVPLDRLRATRTSVKWQAAGPEVIPAWVAEMDARPCPAVVQAVERAMRDGDTGYPWATFFEQAWADLSEQWWGWRPQERHLMLMTDVMTGVHELIRAHTDEGGPVIVTPPVYPSFFGFIDAAHRRCVQVPLGAGFRLDLDALEQAFATHAARERTVFLLCNPHNPTGTVHTHEDLGTVAALARRHGVIVVSDEIHAPLTLPGTSFTPYLSVPDAGPDFAVVSASKAWNLAGLKAALVLAGAEANAPGDRTVGGLHEVHTHGASHIGVIAQTAALVDGRDWLEQVRTEIVQRHALLGRLLAEHLPQVHVVSPQASYLAWLDLSALGLGSDPAAVLRSRAGVMLSNGPDFGEGGSGHARLNVATSPDILEEIVRRITDSVG